MGLMLTNTRLFSDGQFCRRSDEANKRRARRTTRALRRMYNLGAGELHPINMGTREKSDKGERQCEKRYAKLRFFSVRRARELKMIGKALLSDQASGIGAHYSDAALQSGLRILQRVRTRLSKTGADRRDEAAVGLSGGDGGLPLLLSSGGEPLMHPELEEVIRHIREHGMIAGMITNGFLLSKERIASLNAAGLEHLQISIDNVTPDEVSKKSLKTLDSRLEWLSQHAIFQVNINSVSGQAA